MKYDTVLVVISVLICLVGLRSILLNPARSKGYLHYFKLVLIGLSVILVAAAMNSSEDNRWDERHLIAFLCLKEIGTNWIYRYYAAAGYTFLIWGSFGLIVLRIKKQKK